MGAPTKATILIVDDTADNLSLLSSHLKSIYTVKTVNNGDPAPSFPIGSLDVTFA